MRVTRLSLLAVMLGAALSGCSTFDSMVDSIRGGSSSGQHRPEVVEIRPQHKPSAQPAASAALPDDSAIVTENNAAIDALLNNSSSDEVEILVAGQQSGTAGQSAVAAAASSAAVSQTATPARPQSVGESLPDYATGSVQGRHSCNTALGSKASSTAASMAAAQSGALTLSGSIFIAPSVIPDDLLDCIQSVHPQLASAHKGSHSVAQRGSLDNLVSQNQGSSAMIPALIRTGRAQNIDYAVVSVFRKASSGKVSLTLRFIYVADGVTLSEQTRTL